MLDKNFNKMEDEYGKEAICLILQRRDSMSEEEARELIARFEEELSEMIEEDTYSLYDIEETFSEYFGLEPDYLICFLNDVLAKEKKIKYVKISDSEESPVSRSDVEEHLLAHWPAHPNTQQEIAAYLDKIERGDIGDSDVGDGYHVCDGIYAQS